MAVDNGAETPVLSDDLTVEKWLELRNNPPKDPATPAAPAKPAAATQNESGAAADESDEEPATSEEDDQENLDEHGKPKKKGGFQRRIEKLGKRASLAEQERDYWKEQALKSGGKGDSKSEPEKPEKKASEDKPKPKAEDFTTLDEYIDALTDWKNETALKKYESDRETKSKQAQAKSEREKAAQGWQQKQDAAREKYSDYDEVIEADVPITPAMAETMLESELGSELAYWLGKNPKEAERISKLAPIAAAKELGKIEAKIADANAAAQAEKEKDKDGKSGAKPEKKEAPATRAPKPPTPVSKTSAAEEGPRDEDSVDAWLEKRNAQIRKRISG